MAAAQVTVASLQAGAGDKDKLAAELEQARKRNSELEAQLAALNAAGADKDKLAEELATSQQRAAELEKELAHRDRQLAGLRGDFSAEIVKLKDAQRGLVRALRPQIEKGNIMVDLNNERLLINLASGYLFGSGEDELKSAGADALKMFPAEALPPAALRAWRAVLPRGTIVFAVGGMKPDTLAAYWAAGADGFGTGSNLYAPGAAATDVRKAAAAYAAAFRALPSR